MVACGGRGAARCCIARSFVLSVRHRAAEASIRPTEICAAARFPRRFAAPSRLSLLGGGESGRTFPPRAPCASDAHN
jgi:hypothetical protein